MMKRTTGRGITVVGSTLAEISANEVIAMKEINGTHLIVDAYVENHDFINEQYLLATFDEVMEVLNMEKLGDALVSTVPLRPERLSTDEDEGGISVIQPITTSHIALHGWPLRGAIMLDIFSCRPFDAEKAYDVLTHRSSFSAVHKHVIERRDPKPLPKLAQHIFPWERAI
jgi:S-adenosylmethionine decarboxylase